MARPHHLLFILLGWLSFALGVIGAFLPIMPTTPFLLLAAYFFSKGSEKYHRWLLSLPWAGPQLERWQHRGAIGLPSKMLCLISLLFVMFLMAYVLPVVWFGKLGAILTLVTVLGFIFSTPDE